GARRRRGRPPCAPSPAADGGRAAAPPPPAPPDAVSHALETLRSRPLRPGSDVAGALALGRRLAGDGGRLLLLTDGPPATSSALAAARGPLPLFTALSGEENPEAYRVASKDVLPPGSSHAEEGLFLPPLASPAPPARPPPA